MSTFSGPEQRPVSISKVGYRKKSRAGVALLIESINVGPRRLGEGESTDYVMQQESIEFADVKHFFAIDMIGRQYTCNVRKQT